MDIVIDCELGRMLAPPSPARMLMSLTREQPCDHIITIRLTLVLPHGQVPMAAHFYEDCVSRFVTDLESFVQTQEGEVLLPDYEAGQSCITLSSVDRDRGIARISGQFCQYIIEDEHGTEDERLAEIAGPWGLVTAFQGILVHTSAVKRLSGELRRFLAEKKGGDDGSP